MKQKTSNETEAGAERSRLTQTRGQTRRQRQRHRQRQRKRQKQRQKKGVRREINPDSQRTIGTQRIPGEIGS